MVETDTDRRMGLNLNLSMYSLPKPLSKFIEEVSKIEDNQSKVSEIDGYVMKLEEERRKIDVFKRELPLCMILLNEAIGFLKEEAIRCGEMKNKGSVMATNGKFDEIERAKSEIDKKNWMSSAQLWISNPNSQFQSRNGNEDRSMLQNPIQTSNSSSHGGAFLPFSPPPLPPPLPLMTQEIIDCSRIEQRNQFTKTLQSHHHHHCQKKEQRRRWSQELHRKFVDALHRLGGPQVATPKQIRDLMQVDGLTNDEVKSHLQKYRIYTRKNPSSMVATKAVSSLEQGGYGDKESQSLISLSRSDSPQSPLVGRGLFSNGAHSSEEEEEEEERSEGRSWKKSELKKKKRQVLDLEL